MQEENDIAQVNFRMDDDLKKAAEDTFHEMGMTLSTAITIFVAQTVRDRRFPFVISVEPPPSPASTVRPHGRAQGRGIGLAKPGHRIGAMAGKWRVPTEEEDRAMDAEIESACECLQEG